MTPLDLVKFTAAFGNWLKMERRMGLDSTLDGAQNSSNNNSERRLRVVVGRDARISGEMVQSVVEGTLLGCGVDVISLGLASTPTVELAVTELGADGGLILTASHNPKQWNALKLLGGAGEFLNDEQGKQVLSLAQDSDFGFVEVDSLGRREQVEGFGDRHIDMVLALDLVDAQVVAQRGYKVVVDAVNSVGGIVIPELLRRMGVEVVELNCVPDGRFAHNPEPLAENLTQISKMVVQQKADLGVVVDPDVDRLALVCPDGTMFGEEYTLVAVADYVLSQEACKAAKRASKSDFLLNTVSNLSSSRALCDVTAKYGGNYQAAAVGEVNVVAKMKQTNAIIGGEGNGGVIYPELHYGRDALVGIALLLTHLAQKKTTLDALRKTYPEYHISKNKIELTPQVNVDNILSAIKQKYKTEKINDIDGIKIDFKNEWVHLRKSNTEPIIRIYAESQSEKESEKLAQRIIDDIELMIAVRK